MKALTLHQPWASLVADGIKKVETRSWPPPISLVDERFAIHAGLQISGTDFGLTADDPKAMPRGAVVCTVVLETAYRVAYLKYHKYNSERLPYAMFGKTIPGVAPVHASIEIDRYGDFSPGRWVWLLRDIEKLDPPIPARGRQRLWNWEMPT